MHFEISFNGHKNIRSLHKRTIEITRESDLTLRGDCIIGLDASFGCVDLPSELKTKLRDSNSIIKITILVNKEKFIITGRGDEKLTLTHPTDIVIRKSDYTCPRTLAIKCDVGSDSIPRSIIELLKDPKTKGVFIIDTN